MFRKYRISARASRNSSQINENVRIRGTITVSEPLVMAGHLDGDINADTLHVSSTSFITGEVTAQSVTIDGRVHGTVVADKVFLSATAYFEGEIKCQDVSVADGAHINAKFTKEPVTNG